MLNILKAVFGGVMLFLGRDLSWLFSVGIGLLVGQKTTSLLPVDSPLWMYFVLIGVMGVISILPYLVYPDSSYFVTGFLFGGYVLSEYGNILFNTFFGTNMSGSTWLIFFVGAVIGGTILAFTKEWGIMLATALAGAFLVSDIFTSLSSVEKLLIAGGLFIIGGIVQTIIMSLEKKGER